MGKSKYADEACCESCDGFLDSMWGRIDNWMILICGLMAFLIMITSMLPYWRYDKYGTTAIEEKFNFRGFSRKYYGIIHIKGKYSKAWATQAQASCDIRDLSMGLTIAEFILKRGGCSSSESCKMAFTNHAIARCEQYERMSKITYLGLVLTFIGVIFIFSGIISTMLSKRRITGGIAFGLFLFGSILPAIGAGVWAGVTDNAFMILRQTAWYPYPSLYWAFYIYLGGCGVSLVATIIFGVIVLPSVWRYDKATEKLEKKRRKLERKVIRDKNAMKRNDKLQALKAQQMGLQDNAAATAYNFPPPPGFGGGADPNWGAQAMYPPPQQYPPQQPPPASQQQYPPAQQQHLQQYGSYETQTWQGQQTVQAQEQQSLVTGIAPPPQGGPGPPQLYQSQTAPAAHRWPARDDTDQWNAPVQPGYNGAAPRGPRGPASGQGRSFMQRMSKAVGWNQMPGPPPTRAPRG